MNAARHHYFTEEQYLRREREAVEKSEYFDGNVYAMAGGSFRHNRLCQAIGGALWTRLRGRPCQPSSSDQRLMTPGRLYTYPDLAVYCGKMEVRPGTTDVAINPTVLVEVLSDGTREYDTGEKLVAYQGIPSLRHVLLVEPEEARVTVVSRQGSGWVSEVAVGLDAVARLSAIDVELPLAEIYAGLVGPDGPLAI
jgi:Uma2 family endonuclease